MFAKKYCGSLITEDGESKRQPNGILGKRKKLKELGINVYRTIEAVELIKKRITIRDNRAIKYYTALGSPAPDWVGND